MSEETSKPWRVVTEVEGIVLSGHDTEDQALARCAHANREAQNLGIPTRYKVVPRPEPAEPAA